MRLKLVFTDTAFNFFKISLITSSLSIVALIGSIIMFFILGLNYGIDFRGGTSIRTDSEMPIDIAAYRTALSALNLGDVSIAKINDPAKPDQNVTQIRIEQQGKAGTIASELVETAKVALQSFDPTLRFLQVDSVGPKVSGELIKTAVIAVILAISSVLFYIWLRFEWQFSLGAITALIHDVILTIGIFSIVQIKFDLAIIAALLTIIGYSLNDTVVVFDRVRENLRKYKTKPLIDVLNMSINQTLSRTVMTSVTTLIALLSLFVLGGDVIRGFVFAMIWGVIVGTYSSVFIASVILLRCGVKRDWSKASNAAGGQYPGIDA